MTLFFLSVLMLSGYFEWTSTRLSYEEHNSSSICSKSSVFIKHLIKAKENEKFPSPKHKILIRKTVGRKTFEEIKLEIYSFVIYRKLILDSSDH